MSLTEGQQVFWVELYLHDPEAFPFQIFHGTLTVKLSHGFFACLPEAGSTRSIRTELVHDNIADAIEAGLADLERARTRYERFFRKAKADLTARIPKT